MVRGELEREPGGRAVSRDDHEIVACAGDRVVQECGVEPCECSGVWKVEDVVEASAHTQWSQPMTAIAACGAFGRAELSAQEPPVTVRAGYLWSDESVMRQQGTLADWNDDRGLPNCLRSLV